MLSSRLVVVVVVVETELHSGSVTSIAESSLEEPLGAARFGFLNEGFVFPSWLVSLATHSQSVTWLVYGLEKASWSHTSFGTIRQVNV